MVTEEEFDRAMLIMSNAANKAVYNAENPEQRARIVEAKEILRDLWLGYEEATDPDGC